MAIRRIGPDGVIERVAGTGTVGSSPDGTPALEASIRPGYLAFAPNGDLFFTEGTRVRKIADGKIVTVAGNGSSDFSGDGGPAIEAGIGHGPRIAVEADGSLLIAYSAHFRVRRVTPDGIINTIAGTPPSDLNYFTPTGDGGPAANAVIGRPQGLAAGPDGAVYVAGNFPSNVPASVWRILPSGLIEEHSSITGNFSDLAFAADQELLALISGRVRAYDKESNEWLAPIGPKNYGALSASPSGTITAADHFSRVFTINGEEETLIAGVGVDSQHGDGGPAELAHVRQATGIAVANDGTVIYADAGLDRVRRITTDGVMERAAPDSPVSLFGVEHVTVAPDGRIYAARRWPGGSPPLLAIETDGSVSEIPFVFDPFSPHIDELKDIEANGQGDVIVSFRNSGIAFLEVAGSPSSRIVVESFSPNPIALGSDGRVFVGVQPAQWRWISLDGQSEPVAGLTGYQGDFGSASVAVGPDDSLYWTSRSAVWRMLPNQDIDQIAGGPETGYAGDGGPAHDGQFNHIDEMSFGPDGHLYLTDRDRIRRITSPHECPSAGPRPKIGYQGVVNGADYRRLSPGAVFALFGDGVGPEELAGAVLGEDGKLPTELGGTRVLFSGVPAPLIFASSGQVNGIVPFGTRANIKQEGSALVPISGSLGSAVVERNGAMSDEAPLLNYESWPGIFTLDASGNGPGAFLDANSVLIGPDNPATPGSVVVMWATGAGLMDPPQEDGSITTGSPLPTPVLPVTVEIGGLPAIVEYAGAAPGLAAGIIQVNVRIPVELTQTGDVPVRVFVGDSGSHASVNLLPTVYVEAVE